jgi:azurin
MNFRKPTLQEIFTISHIQELTKIQSTHLVNQSLAEGGITEALKKMPINLPIIKPCDQVVFEKKVAGELATNYVKANWRVIICCTLIGGVIVYSAIKIHQKNIKKTTKKYFKMNNPEE